MKKLRLAINGFGRIGRMLVRAYLKNPQKFCGIELIAINDVAEAETLAHLLCFDSTHGRLFDFAHVRLIKDKDFTFLSLTDNHHKELARPIMLGKSNPKDLPWHKLDIDVVLECTGHFRSYDDANLHRVAGARQVIIGAAPFDSVDASIVVGVNDDILNQNPPIISGVSCTTQALVPLLHTLDTAFGIDSVMMTEIHAVTADQTVLDQAHRDLRRARASGHNIIPTTSSSINATERVLPHLQGRLAGYSIRVPTINVACIDITAILTASPTLDQLKSCLKQACQNELLDIMDYTELPLVSSDFIGDTHSLIIDGLQLLQTGRQYKVLAWYDNEVGYANRLLEMCLKLCAKT